MKLESFWQWQHLIKLKDFQLINLSERSIKIIIYPMKTLFTTRSRSAQEQTTLVISLTTSCLKADRRLKDTVRNYSLIPSKGRICERNRGVTSPKRCVRKSDKGSLVTLSRLEEAALRQGVWGRSRPPEALG